MAKKFLILALVFGIASGFGLLTTAQTTPDKSVTGWAWSDNVGWISFNAAGVNGVKLKSPDANNNGNLTGWAWSDNIGWIDFSETSISNGKFTGFAKAEAGDKTVAGGWDGKIRLSDSGPPAYGVVLAADKIKASGFAWGDEVVGWVDFSGVMIGETAGPGELTLTCPANANASIATIDLTTGQASVTWVATASGGDGTYTFTPWSGSVTGPGTGSGATRRITGTFSTPGTVSASTTVTSGTASKSCSDGIMIDCPTGTDWDPATSKCKITEGAGTPELKIIDGDGRIKITAQSNSPVTTGPVVHIQNTGEVAITNIHVDSIKSGSGYDLLANFPETKCRFSNQVAPVAGDWKKCNSLVVDLAPGASAYFAIQIQAYNSEINKHSAYQVKIGGQGAADGTSVFLDPTVVFEYLVGTINPR